MIKDDQHQSVLLHRQHELNYSVKHFSVNLPSYSLLVTVLSLLFRSSQELTDN